MSIENIIGSLRQGDNVAAETAFKSAISDKMSQALETQRVAVAQTMMSTPKQEPVQSEE